MTPVLNLAVLKDLLPAEVVVVGGGPAGLWTAIQAQLNGKNVTVIEKYMEPQRNIRLNIAAHSLKGTPEKLQALTNKWADRSVSIQDMENDLARLAHEVGVSVLKGYRAEPAKLKELFPTARVFVGADGARSKTREEIFQDQFRFNSNLQYMAQVQYVIKGKPEEISGSIGKVKDLSEKYRTQKFAEHLVVQNTRPRSDGSSEVTLQIFIDKNTYDQMADASFKNPYYFEKDLNQVPAVLKEVLVKWWGARHEAHGECIEPDRNNKMTVVALNSYAAKDLVKTDGDGKTWVLVGDAASGFPFFRAVNTAFLLGTQLAQSISQGNYKSYSRYATFRLTIERIRAFFKSLVISFSNLFLSISNRVFWQTNKLSQAQKSS